LRDNRSQTIEEWATDLHASCRPEVLDLIVFP
jgi:hypothetical protein